MLIVIINPFSALNFRNYTTADNNSLEDFSFSFFFSEITPLFFVMILSFAFSGLVLFQHPPTPILIKKYPSLSLN